MHLTYWPGTSWVKNTVGPRNLGRSHHFLFKALARWHPRPPVGRATTLRILATASNGVHIHYQDLQRHAKTCQIGEPLAIKLWPRIPRFAHSVSRCYDPPCCVIHKRVAFIKWALQPKGMFLQACATITCKQFHHQRYPATHHLYSGPPWLWPSGELCLKLGVWQEKRCFQWSMNNMHMIYI